MRIPDCYADREGLGYLRKGRLARLLNAEKLATEYALAASKRPSVTLRFDEVSPGTVGEFIYLYEFVTSLCGELFNVNAYDQPAVELGKQATFALLGRKGYEQLADKIRQFKRIDQQYLA